MKKPNPLPSLAILRELFEYREGQLVRRVTVYRAKAGTMAGSEGRRGYTQVKIQGTLYARYRVIYFMQTGVDPAGLEIDHINGAKSDDRIENLRVATRQQNNHNIRKPRKDNALGVRGVVYCKSNARNPYRAKLNLAGETVYVKYFPTLVLAQEAYSQARLKHYGDFS